MKCHGLLFLLAFSAGAIPLAEGAKKKKLKAAVAKQPVSAAIEADQQLFASIDWRTKDAVTPVKNNAVQAGQITEIITTEKGGESKVSIVNSEGVTTSQTLSAGLQLLVKQGDIVKADQLLVKQVEADMSVFQQNTGDAPTRYTFFTVGGDPISLVVGENKDAIANILVKGPVRVAIEADQYSTTPTLNPIVIFGKILDAVALGRAGYDVWLGNSRGNTYSQEAEQETRLPINFLLQGSDRLISFRWESLDLEQAILNVNDDPTTTGNVIPIALFAGKQVATALSNEGAQVFRLENSTLQESYPTLKQVGVTGYFKQNLGESSNLTPLESTSTNSYSKGGKASTTSRPKPPTHSPKAKASKIFPYYIGPFSCPQQCLSGAATDDGILEANNVKQCDANDKNQEFYLHDTGPFVKIEVAANLGQCLGVAQEGELGGRLMTADFMRMSNLFMADQASIMRFDNVAALKQGEGFMVKEDMVDMTDTEYYWMNNVLYEGDGTGMYDSMTFASSFTEMRFENDGWDPDEVMCNSNLQLVDCTSPAANWYFTGAQYISSLCWSKGYDAVMQVSDDCSHLKVTSAASGADDVPITLSQTFMLVEAESGFIESIVPVPTPSSAPSSESTSEETSESSPTDSTYSPSPTPTS